MPVITLKLLATFCGILTDQDTVGIPPHSGCHQEGGSLDVLRAMWVPSEKVNGHPFLWSTHQQLGKLCFSMTESFLLLQKHLASDEARRLFNLLRWSHLVHSGRLEFFRKWWTRGVQTCWQLALHLNCWFSLVSWYTRGCYYWNSQYGPSVVGG